MRGSGLTTAEQRELADLQRQIGERGGGSAASEQRRPPRRNGDFPVLQGQLQSGASADRQALLDSRELITVVDRGEAVLHGVRIASSGMPSSRRGSTPRRWRCSSVRSDEHDGRELRPRRSAVQRAASVRGVRPAACRLHCAVPIREPVAVRRRREHRLHLRLVEELIAKNPGSAVGLLRRRHEGKGGDGRRRSRALQAQVLGFCDLDLSTPLDQLERVLQVAVRADVLAVGSRTSRVVGPVPKGECEKRWAGSTTVCSRRPSRPVLSTRSGAKVAAREIWEAILTHCVERGYAWDAETIAVALGPRHSGAGGADRLAARRAVQGPGRARRHGDGSRHSTDL